MYHFLLMENTLLFVLFTNVPKYFLQKKMFNYKFRVRIYQYRFLDTACLTIFLSGFRVKYSPHNCQIGMSNSY